MKQLIVFVLLVPAFSKAQMLEANDGVIEFSLGFPNLKPLTDDPSGILHSGFDLGNSSTRSFGQFILKGEYFIAERIGVAGAFNYGYFHSYDEVMVDEYNGTTGQVTTKTYFYEAKVHKARFAVGFNFHALRTARCDSYFGFQAGVKRAGGTYQTNDPSAKGNMSVFVFPIAMRLHYGLRIFFNEFFAANMELGIGGPLVNVGVTYKF